jgi:hypothetical protein
MDNDSGRGSRSDQPPPLATVRPLHLNDVAPDSEAAEDDWYETERLTGQITGRARSAAATEGRVVAPVPSPALDWRHADPEPAPSAGQGLRRGLGRRRRPRAASRLPSAERWLRRHKRAAATRVPARKPFEAPPLATPETVTNGNHPARPLLGFRQGSEPQEPEPRPALGARIRGHVRRLACGRGASIVAVTAVVAAVATVGIAAALNGSPPKPPRAAVVASSARQASDFSAVTKALTAAVGLTERQVGDTRSRHSVRARRANHASQRSSHRARRHPPKARTAALAATSPPASTASSYGGSTSSSPAYSQSSSTPSTSSQSGTSQPASATSTQHSQTTQPAFGQNGVLGPGRGAPGTQ